jgi:hypothetical protein
MMDRNDKNSTRAGRSIENLDNPKNTPIDPGSGSAHGRRMPDYKNDIIVREQTAALDHVQVSAIGDQVENGVIVPDRSTKKRPAK